MNLNKTKITYNTNANDIIIMPNVTGKRRINISIMMMNIIDANYYYYYYEEKYFQLKPN